MTRRPFLASLFSILAAPFVVKKAEAAPTPPPLQSNEEVMRELSKLTSKAQYERMGRHLESIHTGKNDHMRRAWTGDGRKIEVESFQDWNIGKAKL